MIVRLIPVILLLIGATCPSVARADEIYVNDYDNTNGDTSLAEAIHTACSNSTSSDTIYFAYCNDENRSISLTTPITVQSCSGSVVIDSTSHTNCPENPVTLKASASSNIASNQALIILKNVNDIAIHGLIFKNSPAAAVQIKGSSSKTIVEKNTFIDNAKGIELLGGSSSVDNKILNNQFDNRSSTYIVRTNSSSNRGADSPSELYAWIESNKLHVQGNLSKSGEWLIEVYSEDSDKDLYVPKSSFTTTDTKINKTWNNTLGLSDDDRLYVLAHYKSDDYYSTAPLSEAVSVDNEAPNFDADGDGHNSEESGGDDCNDTDADIYPGENESCDGKDNDCDTYTDEEVKITYYKDADKDGYGSNAWTMACSPPAGFVTNDDDCNDSDASIHPGATEQCDGVDNNCDGSIDNARLCDKTLVIATADADGDGYLINSPITENDCNDSDPAIYPDATEICDGVDNDCDSQVDENAVAEVCDSVDNNCDGQIDEGGVCEDDADGDGHTESQGDCDDTNPAVYLGAPEACDAIDSDCDGNTSDGCEICDIEFYLDRDGDGYGDPNSQGFGEDGCSPAPGSTTDGSDCDDTNVMTYPGVTEICEDSRDNDCDGDVDEGCEEPKIDADGDGYTETEGDCDDTDASVHPAAVESCDDSIDNDCDDEVNEGCPDPEESDIDGDGYTIDDGDCDDSDPARYPDAAEIIDDGIDNNCDGQIDETISEDPNHGSGGGCALIPNFS